MLAQKIEKVPLRHKGDELACGLQRAKVRYRQYVVSYASADLFKLVVRALQKCFQQPEFGKQLERGRVNRVAAKIAKKIAMLFQDNDIDAGAREQQRGHHSRRATPGDAALR